MKYFSTHNEFMSCFLSISIEEREKLDKFLDILDESGVGKIIEKELNNSNETRGRKPFNPYKLFAAIIYGFSKHSGSLRKIEESINFDLRFIYLMEEAHPSYVTISKFLNNIVVKNQRKIFSCIVQYILKKYNISFADVFVDGTKLEANANKYKFVWRPTTHKKRLNANAKTLLEKYFSIPESKNSFVPKELGEYLSSLELIIKNQNLLLKTGKGIRSPQIVKDYFLLSKFLIKSLEYEEKEHNCGPYRNSYFKTDIDATAMCLKEDYYSGLGSNMHAGYNVQIAVSKGIILDYYVCQERNDINTFIPFMNIFKEDYGIFPKNICADAGYGSIENYLFLNSNNINNFVKPLSWQQEMDGKSIPLYRIENNVVYCLNNKVAIECEKYLSFHIKRKTHKLYVVENCKRCKYKQVCRQKLKYKKANFRVFEFSKEYALLKEQAMYNLLSPKGIEMRVNRSSQVEGAFGVIKQDMDYERVRRRGLDNVSCEIMLVCLGYVIRKLFLLIENKANLDYWKAPENLSNETRPSSINIKRILSERTIGLNEKLRNKYKRKPIRT